MSETIENTTSDQEPKELDIDQTASLPASVGFRAMALTGLFVLACFYTLYFARDFFIPIVLALVASFLLNPVVRALNRLHVPLMLGSALTIAGCCALIAAIGYQFSGPISVWLSRGPEISSAAQHELEHFRKPVDKVIRTGDAIQSIAKAPEETKTPRQVELKPPSATAGVLAGTLRFAFSFVEFTILLYFLLASGDLFLRKLIHVTPRFEDKKRAVKIAREIEDSISRYLLTVAGINFGLGTAGALAFFALGMPDPALWGALGFALNFIPYLGALTTATLTGMVALITFPHPGHAILVPLSYLALATIEGSLVTPWIVGRRMMLNSVVIFAGLILWGFLWGVAGTLLAVPLLVMLKIFCDHIEPLAPIGEFLGS